MSHSHDTDNTRMESQLEERHIQPTSVRLLVLRHMLANDHAVSLTDLQDRFVKSDKSTLFRTLKKFEEHKLIHSIDDGTGQVKYALCKQSCECKPEDLHCHFHCLQCEETFCLSNQPVPSIELPSNFTMQQANMVIKGVCSNCTM